METETAMATETVTVMATVMATEMEDQHTYLPQTVATLAMATDIKTEEKKQRYALKLLNGVIKQIFSQEPNKIRNCKM